MSTFKLYLLLALLLTFSATQVSAQRYLAASGFFTSYSNRTIHLDDLDFPVLSTVKVILPDNQPGKISDIKRGDGIDLLLVVIDKKRYVDVIRVHKREE